MKLIEDLGGYVNQQNYHIWGNDNPKSITELPVNDTKFLCQTHGIYARGVDVDLTLARYTGINTIVVW